MESARRRGRCFRVMLDRKANIRGIHLESKVDVTELPRAETSGLRWDYYIASR